jgi:hypothetical protein
MSQGYQMQRLTKQLESKVYISNDPTSTKVEERTEEHIQTGQLGNIITTSYNRVLAMVQSTSQI